MKKILILLVASLSFAGCIGKQKESALDDLIMILATQPGFFQVSATITSSSSSPIANAMVYFSKTSTTTSASVRATSTSTSSTSTTPVFETSSQTDSSGNLSFTLAIGEYQAYVTSTDNKSQAFKIKIENGEALSINKDGKATITYADGTIKVAIIKVSGLLSNVPSPSISFVCGYNPKGDTAPPELTSVTLGSETLDLSSGSGKVTIKAKLADGYEGTADAKKASGIKSVTAKLYNPKGVSAAYATLTLNSSSGLYEGDATLTNYVDNGTYKVGLVSGRDNAGNERQYILDTSKSSTNYIFNGCGQKIDSKVTIQSVVV